jgi:hypothetical protein
VSNRFQLVPQEFASGLIEGVNFGPEIYVIARSPSAALIWVRPHTWSVNGHRSYAEGKLYALPDRTPQFTRRPTYKQLASGGRLHMRRLMPIRDDLVSLFGGKQASCWVPEGRTEYAETLMAKIGTAVFNKMTLLIDLGGGQLAPPRRLGAAAYMAWQAQPNRGWVTKVAA